MARRSFLSLCRDIVGATGTNPRVSQAAALFWQLPVAPNNQLKGHENMAMTQLDPTRPKRRSDLPDRMFGNQVETGLDAHRRFVIRGPRISIALRVVKFVTPGGRTMVLTVDETRDMIRDLQAALGELGEAHE